MKSHLAHGSHACLDGLDLGACPHVPDTLKQIDWTVGWLEAAVGEPMTRDPDMAERTEEHESMLAAAIGRRRDAYRRISALLPKARDAAAAMRVPLKAWPGQCYAVATALNRSGLLDAIEDDHGRGRVAYGIYRGPVDGGLFYGRAFPRHGWIEYGSGLVIDPTRWVFENTMPTISAAPIDDYDLAGRLTRHLAGAPPRPAFDPAGRTATWNDDDAEATRMIAALLDAGDAWDGRIGFAQMVWLGNLPLEQIEPHAAAIYRFFAREKLLALIPIDHRNWVASASPKETEFKV